MIKRIPLILLILTLLSFVNMVYVRIISSGMNLLYFDSAKGRRAASLYNSGIVIFLVIFAAFVISVLAVDYYKKNSAKKKQKIDEDLYDDIISNGLIPPAAGIGNLSETSAAAGVGNVYEASAAAGVGNLHEASAGAGIGNLHEASAVPAPDIPTPAGSPFEKPQRPAMNAGGMMAGERTDGLSSAGRDGHVDAAVDSPFHEEELTMSLPHTEGNSAAVPAGSDALPREEEPITLHLEIPEGLDEEHP